MKHHEKDMRTRVENHPTDSFKKKIDEPQPGCQGETELLVNIADAHMFPNMSCRIVVAIEDFFFMVYDVVVPKRTHGS